MIYVEARCAIIHKTKERFGELSNMCSGFPLLLGSETWFSSEALYQACRFPGRPDLHNIINIPNAMTSKMKSKPHRSGTRADWLDVRVLLMETVLRIKVEQHRETIMKVLFDTGWSRHRRKIAMREELFSGKFTPPDLSVIVSGVQSQTGRVISMVRMSWGCSGCCYY